MTKEKVGTKGASIIFGTEPLLRRPVNLLRTINWFVPENSLSARIIKSLVKAVSDLDPDPHIGEPDLITGSPDHRYRDAATKHGALISTLYTMGTYMHLSTETMSKYSKGTKNVNLHFQAMMCLAQHHASMDMLDRIENGVPIPPEYRQEVICEDCISQLDENFYDLTDESVLDMIPSDPTNPYLYTLAENVKERDNTLYKLFWEIPYLSQHGLDRLSSDDISKVLHESFVYLAIEEITTEISSEIVLSSGMGDSGDQSVLLYNKLRPKTIYGLLHRGLYLRERWKMCSSNPGLSPTQQQITAKLLRYISHKPSELFQRLGLFWSWTKSASRMRFAPYMQPPLSYPISSPVSCETGKWNLYHYIKNNQPFENYHSSKYLIESIVRSPQFIVKEKLWLAYVRNNSQKSSCEYCEMTWDILIPAQNLGVLDYSELRCQNGHTLISRDDIVQSFCPIKTTVKKITDVADDLPIVRGRSMAVKVSPIKKVQAQEICSAYMFKLFVETPPAESSTIFDQYQGLSRDILDRIITIPTGSQFRLYEALSFIFNQLSIPTGIFCVGDGYGGTSLLLSQMFSCKVITSTLISP